MMVFNQVIKLAGGKMISLNSRLRLRYSSYLSLRHKVRRCTHLSNSNVNDFEPSTEVKDSRLGEYDARIGRVKDRIIYSSILHRNEMLSWKEKRQLLRKKEEEARRERYNTMKEHLFPIALKYTHEFASESVDDRPCKVESPLLELGPEMVSHHEMKMVRTEPYSSDEVQAIVPIAISPISSLESQNKGKLVKKSGSKGNTSCGGCGAIIQCENQYSPGFIPLEFLSSFQRSRLSLLCQRCYLTKSLKISLQVNFDPLSCLTEMTKLRSRRALIMAVFDVTDVSSNICKSITDFVGEKHPVILVGNKVDLLPPDSPGYLHRVRDYIKRTFESKGLLNIKDVFLVSCVSGIGIESLITKLYSIWKNYGDIYLVGHTNVGKSSLFNALLNSDLCKAVKSSDIQCATTSPWPGTTLGTLKFPLTRPAGEFMLQRTKRIQMEHMEKQLAKMESTSKQHKGYLASPDTFVESSLEDINCEMGASAVSRTVIPLGAEKLIHLGMSPSKMKDQAMRWCHDTPGIPNFDRTLELLTPDEVRWAQHGSRMIIPRTFYVKVGLSLFIGGLARMDHCSGNHPICMTVFSSRQLPIVVCATADAEEMYAALVGTRVLGVPQGGGEGHLDRWPPLAAKDYEVTGCGWKESCADVLLSSAGWVAVTAGRGMVSCVRAHTPGALGIELRTPPLMPYSVLQKGPRRRNSPAYLALKEHLFTKYSS